MKPKARKWIEVERYQQFVTTNEDYTIWIDNLYDINDELIHSDKDISALKAYAQEKYQMKTYEEIITKNPNAAFFVGEDEYYCCNEDGYSLIENLRDNYIAAWEETPKVYLAVNKRIATEEDFKNSEYYCNNFDVGDVICDKGKEINIDNLWKELQNENI
jgi:hypothetical protein